MKKLCYEFQNPALLEQALTHSSYANEHRAEGVGYNERLEFLGDAVLGFVTADYLYNNFPDLPEGKLTRLRAAVVCEGALSEIAKDLGIAKVLRLGHGEAQTGGSKRPSILADATEAVIGAMYLDGGIAPARELILRYIPDGVQKALAGDSFRDYKTMLQEVVQKNKQEKLSYRLAAESGPDHDKRFTMQVCINQNVFAEGEGRSKKEAEQQAAKKALQLMQLV